MPRYPTLHLLLPSLLLLPLLHVHPSASSTPHPTPPPITRLAFGSCNKQGSAQPLWEHVLAFDPQAWLWTGDSVYAKTHGWNVSALEVAYAQQRRRAGYAQLLERGIVVDGVFDDHALGMNDAGGGHPILAESRRCFLDFLGTPAESPRRRRPGMYGARTLGGGAAYSPQQPLPPLPPQQQQPPPEQPPEQQPPQRPPQPQVKVLFLDVRSQRGEYAIPHLPESVPLSAVFNALLRMVSWHSGLSSTSQEDMLGEEQWRWLEEELRGGRGGEGNGAEEEGNGGKASVHLLVSTVQVLTRNPFVESWLHFPRSKARLLRLLLKYRPSGLLLLSGDVHFAELTGGRGDAEALEVTSSGMTHSCSSAWYGFLCTLVMNAYHSHRVRPDATYSHLNYGEATFDWGTAKGNGGSDGSDGSGGSGSGYRDGNDDGDSSSRGNSKSDGSGGKDGSVADGTETTAATAAATSSTTASTAPSGGGRFDYMIRVRDQAHREVLSVHRRNHPREHDDRWWRQLERELEATVREEELDGGSGWEDTQHTQNLALLAGAGLTSVVLALLLACHICVAVCGGCWWRVLRMRGSGAREKIA